MTDEQKQKITIVVTKQEFTALLDGLHLEIVDTRDAAPEGEMFRAWRESMLKMMEALEDRLSAQFDDAQDALWCLGDVNDD